MVYSWLKNIQFALLPGRCIICEGNSRRQLDLCHRCQDLLCATWTRCQHCALPTPQDVDWCGHCTRRPFHFTRCIALAPYRQPIDRLISALKYHHHLAAGKVTASLLAEQIPAQYRGDTLPERLIPVPLHWRRQWRRGFNQAYYLAHRLQDRLDIPLQNHLVTRVRHTPRQTALDRSRRQKNLKKAFRIRHPVPGEHLALVDDVVTTGATANLLAALLLENGASRVDVWCLARTAAGSTQ